MAKNKVDKNVEDIDKTVKKNVKSQSKKTTKNNKNIKIAKDTRKNNDNKNSFISELKKKISSMLDKNDNKNTKSKKKNNYQKKKQQKNNKKKMVDGKFSLDVLDLLIIVVITAIVSCVLTGFILNKQYRETMNYIDEEVISDEGVKNFLDTYDEIVDNFYKEIDKNKMLEAALEGMLTFLEDKYSIYLDKNETDSLSEMLDGSYEGIGIVAYGNVVYNIYKGSPAEKAGLKVNDEIIEVNGNEINMENFASISDLLTNEKVNIVVVKREGKEMKFEMELSTVNVPTTTSDIITSQDKKKDIGYLALTSFSSHSFEDFQDSLLKLEKDKIDSLIIDLRDNTGGYLNVAEDISSLFLEKGKLIYSLESKDDTKHYKDKDSNSRSYEIVVLVNSNTASAAEILAAALHDSYGAKIVGNTTLGKGKVQTMKYYEDTMVKYTSAKWLRPNGECIDQIGIVPDYEVSLQYTDNIIYDLQLDKAIELLS